MDSSNPKLYSERDRPKKAGAIKVRFIIAVLATLCPVVCYISRQNLPFAIVSMVDDEPPSAAYMASIASTAAATAPAQVMNVAAVNQLNGNDLDDQDDVAMLPKSTPNMAPQTNATSARYIIKSNATTTTTTSRTSNNSTQPPPNNYSGVLDGTCPLQMQLGGGGGGQADGKSSTKGYGPKYRWSAEDKGYLLGAFFWTYVFCQIPGARLAEKIGAKWILVAATAGSALCSLVSPWSASVHVHLLSLVRILMGVCQAALYPACYVLYAKWLPPIERSQALPILCVGAYLGSIVASSMTGYFSEQPHLGWEYSFYLPGVLCALWTLAWIMLASNEPREHPTISIEELTYIESKLEVQHRGGAGCGAGGQDANGSQTGAAGNCRPEISWRKLFTSRSIWAMMVGFFASNWSFTIVLLLIPTYLNKILHVSPMNSGIINSIIYVLYCISSPLVGTGSTMMVETRSCGLSRLNIRKLFQGTALFGQAICFIAVALLGCEQNYVFGVLFIQIVLFSFVNGGEVQLPTELSVDFAGTIYAIGNCVGSSTGFIVPLVYSQIVENENSRDQWKVYFLLAAAISTLGGLIFVLFGANHLQDFSKDDDDDDDLEGSQMNICKLTGMADSRDSSYNLNDEAAAAAADEKQRRAKNQRQAGQVMA